MSHFNHSLFLKLFSLLSLLIIGLIQTANAKYDPALDWYTIETEHFQFHYHDGLEAEANDIADQAEAIQQEISAYFDWTPEQKTHVVLSDHIDLPNGTATPLPNNRIELFMSPPSDIFSLEDYDDWKSLVFKHEFVHIAHLDKAEDFPLHARKFLGRFWLFFPNTFSPRWITEGIATYLETDEEKKVGRGQSSYFRGLMRNEVMKGIKSLDEMNQLLEDWPSGTAAYLYGVYFFKFLKSEFGDEKIQEFVSKYSQFPIPFFINSVSRQVFGKTTYSLWLDFEFYLHREFDEEIKYTRFNTLENEKISASGYFSGFSKVMENGHVLTIESDRENIKQLVQYDPQSKQRIPLFRIYNQDAVFGQTFDYHENQGIVIPLLEFAQNSRLHFDLFHFDLKTEKLTRLTEDQRYIRAIWSPDGQYIMAVRNHQGKHSLELLDNQGKYQETLVPTSDNLVFSAFDWSPDGNKLAVSVLRHGQNWNLELFDISARNWQAITRNDWIESHPQFSEDGKSLYFTADYSCIYNIFQIDLQTRKLQQLSNTPTVALYPAINEKSGTLYYAELGDDGFNIHAQDAASDPIPLRKNLLEENFDLPELTITNKQEKRPSRPYQALSKILPPWWFPVLIWDKYQKSVGFFTATNDPLYWHNYQLTLEVDLKNTEALWDFTYLYSRLTPDFVFGSRKMNYYPNDDFGRNETEVQISTILPFLNTRQQWNGFIAYKKLWTDFFELANRDNIFAEFSDEIFSTGIIRNSSQKPSRAVNSHSGTYFSTAIENNKLSNIDADHSRVVLGLNLYSPLIYHSVLEAAATVVSGGGLAGNNFLGGSQRDENTDLEFGKRTYGLKGYAPDSFKGTNLQKLELTAHIPIAKPQTGTMAPPIGVRKIRLHPFVQAARIDSYSEINDAPWYKSVGAELSIALDFGYGRIPFTTVIGAAKGLDDKGETVYYVNVNLDI